MNAHEKYFAEYLHIGRKKELRIFNHDSHFLAQNCFHTCFNSYILTIQRHKRMVFLMKYDYILFLSQVALFKWLGFTLGKLAE